MRENATGPAGKSPAGRRAECKRCVQSCIVAYSFSIISHITRVSKHGLGLAVDINTLYNPYTKVVDGKRIVEPVTGEPYLDHEASFDYKIDKGDLCYNLFLEHGFEWGGEWPDRKDYQHFEMPDSKIAEWYPENAG